ncbi:MAG: 16S rRNA (cytosine(1402)-N(4))-methyltransferase RsmH [Deltaproteobacteria bacterium]|nr:16S rRNA (cytosine(1402)-N(4))-methyltransferase RsmH [Deltaproteobacteria bacterium]
MIHHPVLLPEVLRYLAPRSGGTVVDGTVGLGGHAEAILEASAPDGRLVGLDRDAEVLPLAAARLERFGPRVRLLHAPARDMGGVLAGVQVDGVLLDFGVSGAQLDDPARGFSFQATGPLDLRMDRSCSPSGADLVNEVSERDLADLLHRYGEEPQARRIARAIVKARPIETTTHLADVVARAAGGRRGRRIHPATRTFQAIRIAVNHELEEVEGALRAALDVVAPGGRIVAIAFHSLEDRLSKQILNRSAGVGAGRDAFGHPLGTVRFRRLTPRAVQGSDPHPRARSARLRAVERMPDPTAEAARSTT